VSDVRFGVQISGQRPEGVPVPRSYLDAAVDAEEAGFDSVWAGDHISFHNPILECIVALAAFAGCTRRVALGAGVLLLPLRRPAVVAKQITSLDYLSEGRVILGVGVGGEGEKDFEAVGVPPRERGSRTDEGIAVLRALFASEVAAYDGRFTRFSGVTLSPRSPRSEGPPIWIGGRSDAALRRAGRSGDGWLAYMASPRRFAEGLEVIRAECERSGREPDAVCPAILVPTCIAEGADQARRLVREHLTNRYARPYPDHVVTSYCLAGTAAQVVERLQHYIEAGARHIVFVPAGRADAMQEDARRIFEEVVRPLQGAVAA
jgi:probable F420-dependent oxidoreductase